MVQTEKFIFSCSLLIFIFMFSYYMNIYIKYRCSGKRRREVKKIKLHVYMIVALVLQEWMYLQNCISFRRVLKML